MQAEALVPDQIPLDYVEHVAFVSEASRAEGERLWGELEHPPFEVDPGYFADDKRSRIPSFAYLGNLVLTSERITKDSERITKDNVSQSYSYQVRFPRTQSGRITAIAGVRVLAGTRARVRWEPIGQEKIKEFERSGYYWHWPNLSMDDLPHGPCSIEYYLNNIRWIRMNFELVEE